MDTQKWQLKCSGEKKEQEIENEKGSIDEDIYKLGKKYE